jgi:hypothetical protein
MIKAALVNTQTNIVENIIIVDSINDSVDEGYLLVEIPIIQESIEYSQNEIELYDVLESIDPEFIRPLVYTEKEFPVYIGVTRWTEQDGLYNE